MKHDPFSPDEHLSARGLDDILLALIRGETFPGMAASTCRALLERSRVHNATLLIIDALSGCVQDDTVLAEINRMRLRAVAHEIRMAHQAAKAVQAFIEAGIRVQMMKGSVLWRALDLAGPSKVSADIDLLVAPEDVQKADRVLGELGYRCTEVDPHEATYYLHHQPTIDLHWSIIRWLDQSPDFWERMWENRVMVMVEGREIPTLSPTHTTLSLLLHAGCHHMCADWASLYDIAQCTKKWKRNIDWQEMIALAEGAGLTYALHPPLRLASDFFSAFVPTEMAHVLGRHYRRFGLNWIARLGFAGRLNSSFSHDNAKRMWNLLSQVGLRQMISLSAAWTRHHIGPATLPIATSPRPEDRT